MHKLISAIGFTAAVAIAASAQAQTGGTMVGTAPGKAMAAQTVKIATITAIDKATRDVTLRVPRATADGYCGPEIKNFDMLQGGRSGRPAIRRSAVA